ncbi:MAG: hypothetical protein ACT4NY_26390 [Pseudonocardiales bacterium]
MTLFVRATDTGEAAGGGVVLEIGLHDVRRYLLDVDEIIVEGTTSLVPTGKLLIGRAAVIVTVVTFAVAFVTVAVVTIATVVAFVTVIAVVAFTVALITFAVIASAITIVAIFTVVTVGVIVTFTAVTFVILIASTTQQTVEFLIPEFRTLAEPMARLIIISPNIISPNIISPIIISRVPRGELGGRRSGLFGPQPRQQVAQRDRLSDSAGNLITQSGGAAD